MPAFRPATGGAKESEGTVLGGTVLANRLSLYMLYLQDKERSYIDAFINAVVNTVKHQRRAEWFNRGWAKEWLQAAFWRPWRLACGGGV